MVFMLRIRDELVFISLAAELKKQCILTDTY